MCCAMAVLSALPYVLWMFALLYIHFVCGLWDTDHVADPLSGLVWLRLIYRVVVFDSGSNDFRKMEQWILRRMVVCFDFFWRVVNSTRSSCIPCIIPSCMSENRNKTDCRSSSAGPRECNGILANVRHAALIHMNSHLIWISLAFVFS